MALLMVVGGVSYAAFAWLFNKAAIEEVAELLGLKWLRRVSRRP